MSETFGVAELLTTSPRPADPLGTSPERSLVLRERLEGTWSIQISRELKRQGMDFSRTMMPRGWEFDIRTCEFRDHPGCEGYVREGVRPSIAIRLAKDWRDIYEKGWSMLDGTFVVAVASMDHDLRPSIALGCQWVIKERLGEWSARLAPWWFRVSYPEAGKVRTTPLSPRSTADEAILAELPTPWPIAA